ncbi:MAG: hypothetical protein QME42_09685 [bacterium]|nr:hypothetical protein [bacterium]
MKGFFKLEEDLDDLSKETGGSMIVKEAGGIVSNINGTDIESLYDSGINIIVSVNPVIHKTILTILRKFGEV